MTTEQALLANAIIPGVLDPEYPRCDKPLVDEGKLVASDGRILIVLDDPGHYSGDVYKVVDGRFEFKGSMTHAYDWRQLLRPIEGISSWHPVPAVEGPPKHASPRWEVPLNCEDCDGAGTCRCRCGEIDHPCPECKGRGKSVSETAELEEARERIAFGNADIARRYAWLVSTLPEVVWAAASDSSNSMIFFRFEGGCGAVMPLAKE